MRGKFITFEGGEGGGKTTQGTRLRDFLASVGITARVTREPGGTPLAEIMRGAILGGSAKPSGPEVEALLFAAARADHIHRVLRPAVEAGQWIICDRFMDSTRVYQQISGVAMERLLEIERAAIDGFTPDLTIILDLSAEQSAARTARRRGIEAADRFEAEDAAFHARIRQGFLDIAAAEPQRCVVVDASAGIEDVARAISDVVTRRCLQAAPARAIRR